MANHFFGCPPEYLSCRGVDLEHKRHFVLLDERYLWSEGACLLKRGHQVLAANCLEQPDVNAVTMSRVDVSQAHRLLRVTEKMDSPLRGTQLPGSRPRLNDRGH